MYIYTKKQTKWFYTDLIEIKTDTLEELKNAIALIN